MYLRQRLDARCERPLAVAERKHALVQRARRLPGVDASLSVRNIAQGSPGECR